MNRKARDSKIAVEIVDELTKVAGPIAPADLTANSETVGDIFGAALDKYGIVRESAAANVLKCVPRVLAKNFAERDAAMRQRKT